MYKHIKIEGYIRDPFSSLKGFYIPFYRKALMLFIYVNNEYLNQG